MAVTPAYLRGLGLQLPLALLLRQCFPRQHRLHVFGRVALDQRGASISPACPAARWQGLAEFGWQLGCHPLCRSSCMAAASQKTPFDFTMPVQQLALTCLTRACRTNQSMPSTVSPCPCQVV